MCQSEPFIRFQSHREMNFNPTSCLVACNLAKRRESLTPLMQKRRRILENFKRAFPDEKVPDSFTLSKEECAVFGTLLTIILCNTFEQGPVCERGPGAWIVLPFERFEHISMRE
jgi:hypothetical protein